MAVAEPLLRITELSSRLNPEFGNDFDPSNLAKIRAFLLA
jgi:hypothetical protein